MMDMYEKIGEIAAGFENDMVDFARRLIQTKSISGTEGGVAKLYQDEMKKLGYDEVFQDAAGNVIGLIRGDEEGPTIMFNSHMDHVSEGDVANWEGYDPYGAEIDVCEVDNREKIGTELAKCIHGRAASDTKGGGAVQIYSGAIILKLRELGYPIKGTYMFTGVVLEETSECAGMKYMVDHTFKERGLDYDALVSSEATSLNLYLGHRGRTEFLITVYGRTSHGSAPWLGINAIYKAMPLIAKLKDELYPSLPSDEKLGKSTISLNIIECSPGALSIVPDKCMLSIDRRTVPGETDEEVLAQFQKVIDEVAATDPEFKADVKIKSAVEKTFTGMEMEEVKNVLPWRLPEDHPFTDACAEGLKEIGQDAKLDYWIFATDMSLNSGRDKKPSIGYSPMQEQYAHTPYDKVRIDFMMEALSGNAAIFLKSCEAGKGIGQSL